MTTEPLTAGRVRGLCAELDNLARSPRFAAAHRVLLEHVIAALKELSPREDECSCYWTDPKTWTTHYGAAEPGSQMEPNPDCPVHFPSEDADLDRLVGLAWATAQYPNDLDLGLRNWDDMGGSEPSQERAEFEIALDPLLARVRTAETAVEYWRTQVLASRAAEPTPVHCPSCDDYQTDVMDDGQRSVGVCEGVEARAVETAEESGAALIAAERVRQVTEESYTEEDYRGQWESLTAAAINYATGARFGWQLGDAPPSIAVSWPWHLRFWKPTGDSIRDLTMAGALIAAAIDSLRLSPVQPTPEATEVRTTSRVCTCWWNRSQQGHEKRCNLFVPPTPECADPEEVRRLSAEIAAREKPLLDRLAAHDGPEEDDRG